MALNKYVVMQVILKEKLLEAGSNIKTLTELEKIINKQASLGYRLHTVCCFLRLKRVFRSRYNSSYACI